MTLLHWTDWTHSSTKKNRLPSWCSWGLRSSGMLRGVDLVVQYRSFGNDYWLHLYGKDQKLLFWGQTMIPIKLLPWSKICKFFIFAKVQNDNIIPKIHLVCKITRNWFWKCTCWKRSFYFSTNYSTQCYRVLPKKGTVGQLILQILYPVGKANVHYCLQSFGPKVESVFT